MKYITALFLTLITTSTFADSYCTGKIEMLGISKMGTVILSGPGGLAATYLCNTETSANGVTTSACNAMYSKLLSAQAQGKEVKVTFNPPLESCTDAAAWGWAKNLNWIMVY